MNDSPAFDLLHRAAQTVNAQRGLIVLRQTLVIAASLGYPPERLKLWNEHSPEFYWLKKEQLLPLYERRHSVLTTNALNDHYTLPFPYDAEANVLRSVILAPFFKEKQVVGTVVCEVRFGDHQFTEAERSTLDAFVRTVESALVSLAE